jgi:hypothetical protein
MLRQNPFCGKILVEPGQFRMVDTELPAGTIQE